MITKMKYALSFLLLATSIALNGCNNPAGVPPIPVKGRVLINGQPAPNIEVIFTDAQDRSKSSTGMTGADGAYQLTTVKINDGARPGKYKVVFNDADAVAPTATPKPKTSDEGFPDSSDPNYLEAMKKASDPSANAGKEPRFPAKYSDPAATSLEREVAPGQQEFEFEIGK